MTRSVIAAAIALSLGSAMLSAADEGVSTARALYAAAEYENALALLNKLRASGPMPEETSSIEQYRAFCLIALGRREDADLAIAALLQGEPSFHPSDSETSPRVRSAFTD